MSKQRRYLTSVLVTLLVAAGAQAGVITVGSAADTWVAKTEPNAQGTLPFMAIHGGSADRTGYVRFDLSGLKIKSIQSATLTLSVHGSIPKPPFRNDSVVAGRFALYGLSNVIGNTPQDWDEAGLTSASTGAEMDWTTGSAVLAGGQTVDLDDGVPGITETVVPAGSPGNASLGATVTITGEALVSFLQSRVDDNGLVTFILKDDDSSDRGYGLCTKEYADAAYRPKLELTATLKKVIFVSAMYPSATDANIPGDQGFVNVLKAAGYDVDYAPGTKSGNAWVGYWETLDPNKIAALNAADLVIIARGSNSSGMASDATEVAAWTNVKAPLMLMSTYIAANNRWYWINTDKQSARESYYLLGAVDVNHPIFAGMDFAAGPAVQWFDPNVASGYANFPLTADAGNGKVLALKPDTGNMLIAEWLPGKPFYATSSQTPAGRRMLFDAGTQEVSGQKVNWGVMNLNAVGQKIFLNAVAYLMTPLPPEPVPVQ